MMLVLATVRYESVTLPPRERQLVAVPGKISYGEAKARLLGSCITTAAAAPAAAFAAAARTADSLDTMAPMPAARAQVG